MSSREVQDAVGEAPARKTDQSLEQRAAELRRVVTQPTEKERASAELAGIERQLAESREANGKKAAQERLLGIRRACGSVMASMDADEKRILEAKAEYEDAIRRLNDRYGQAIRLKAEAEALCNRFGLPVPDLANVTAPAQRGLNIAPSVDLVGHSRLRQHSEKCEHQLRERRTYSEVRGSEGHQIIATAGLSPFPKLTDQQQRVVDARGRAEDARTREGAKLTDLVESTTRAMDTYPTRGGIGGS